MKPPEFCCGCGKSYWPAQRWMHNGCVQTAGNSLPRSPGRDSGEAVDARVLVANGAVVANAKPVKVVANRGGDRHKRTPERAEYMRELMRARRANA